MRRGAAWPDPRLRFWALWAAAGALEAPAAAVLMAADTGLPGTWCVLGHLGAAALAFLAPPKERGLFHPTRHWGEALGLLVLLVPAAGWAIGGWLVLRRSKSVQDKEAYLFEEEEDVAGDAPSEAGAAGTIRQEMADALGAMPAVDALLIGDPSLKRGAIEALSRIRTGEAIGWILKARHDPSPDVRFFATSALTRLKRDFESAIQAAQREVYARPGDLAAQVALERIRYAYAVSGMLEPETRDRLLRQCRDRMAALADFSLEALLMKWMAERNLDPAASLETLERLSARDPAGSQAWVLERAAQLFDLGRFREVLALLRARREDLLAWADRSPGGRERRVAVVWWTHG